MTFSYFRDIHLCDTDAAGVIYFARGLSICHEAYEEWLQSLGLSIRQILQEKEIAIPIVRAEIDFLQPIICGDAIEIKLKLQEVTESKFIVSYDIFKNTYSDKILAKALTIHVCINPQTRKKAALPQAITDYRST